MLREEERFFKNANRDSHKVVVILYQGRLKNNRKPRIVPPSPMSTPSPVVPTKPHRYNQNLLQSIPSQCPASCRRKSRFPILIKRVRRQVKLLSVCFWFLQEVDLRQGSQTRGPRERFVQPGMFVGNCQMINVYIIRLIHFTHRCLKVLGQRVNKFLTNELREGWK